MDAGRKERPAGVQRDQRGAGGGTAALRRGGVPPEVAAEFRRDITARLRPSPASPLRAVRDRVAGAEAGGERAAAVQRRDARVVLQHGSILCGPAHRRLADYLSARDPELIARRAQGACRRRPWTLRRSPGGPVEMERLAVCIRQGFERDVGDRFPGGRRACGRWADARPDRRGKQCNTRDRWRSQ